MLPNRAFSTVSNKGQKQKVATSPLPSGGGGAKEGEMVRNPCILGGPQQRPHHENWQPHPCFLGGPKESENAT